MVPFKFVPKSGLPVKSKKQGPGKNHWDKVAALARQYYAASLNQLSGLAGSDINIAFVPCLCGGAGVPALSRNPRRPQLAA
jgi:hypothetical protein